MATTALQIHHATWPQITGTIRVSIKLTLTEDETEILIDALEADMEGYIEAAKEARGNQKRDDVQTFTEAAERIQALKARLESLIER